jgi:hypothetical protein
METTTVTFDEIHANNELTEKFNMVRLMIPSVN